MLDGFYGVEGAEFSGECGLMPQCSAEKTLSQMENRSDISRRCPQERPANIAILLCTYQGERFLAEQLDSFLSQSYRYWKVWASDDGSSDGTLALLDAYRDKLGGERLSVLRGPGQGFVANFLSLACRDEVRSDYYAYADQDDIWLDDKLERAVRWLDSLPHDVPALYCSRTMLVDTENVELALSPLFGKLPSFANALAQNIASGNTMVFNAAARDLIRQGGVNMSAAAHDWWTYMIVTGCGGKVFYDHAPSLRYRQHGSNLMGLDTSVKAKLVRWRLMWHGRLRRWNDANLASLMGLRALLTEESCRVLEHFMRARLLPFPLNLVELWRSGVHRHSLVSNLSMIVALVFKKM